MNGGYSNRLVDLIVYTYHHSPDVCKEYDIIALLSLIYLLYLPLPSLSIFSLLF